MPKQTFINLPKEKKENILNEAMLEFGHYGFDLSSIQRIIEQSGISRGSFYQYFEDKADIFGEVLIEISARKMKYLEPVLQSKEEYGLFELIEKLLMQAVEFGMDDPLAFQIGKDLFTSKTLNIKEFLESLKKEIYKRNHISPESLYLKAIENSIKRGEISTNYSIEMILFYAQGMIDKMSELYWHQMTRDPRSGEAEKTISDMLSIFKYGLSSSNKTS
ncbi:MAG: TetR/AcrR family transcriptional regulator [Bacteroidota bacterium]|nr:TetR/AcrR family transcriptional regulator [Bacteroidota bacterium]